jgi:TetR/AcrR family transcriptional repressor of bet genes
MPRLDVRSIRRDQILDAAERLVARRGWGQTSFSELCREADVSNGVLTYHFKDKDDLFLSLFERAAGRWRDHLEAGLCSGCGTAPERIEVLFREAAEKAERERPLYLLLLHYLSEAPDHPEIADRLDRLFGGMRQRVGETLRAEAGVVDPAVGAGVLQTVILGFILGRAALGLQVPPEELATMVSAYLTQRRPATPAR